MTQRCTDFGEDRPWYARGARRGGVALAAATVVVMFGAFGAAPASAAWLPPAEIAVFTISSTSARLAQLSATSPSVWVDVSQSCFLVKSLKRSRTSSIT